MAEVTESGQQDILKQLKAMTTALEDTGSIGAGSMLRGRGRADDEEKQQAKVSQKLAERLSKKMQKSGNAQIRAQGRLIKNIDDVYRAQERFNKFNMKTFIQIKEQRKAELITEQQAEEQLKNIGSRLSDLDKPLIIVSDRYKEQIDILGDVNEKLMQSGARSQGMSKAFMVLKGVIGVVGKQAYDVARASMRTGLSMTANQIWQSRAMGMSQVELIETQAQFRNAMESSSMSSDQFSDMMLSSSYALYKFTGDLKQGAVFAAQNAQMYRDLGASGNTQKEFMDAQASSFKNLHNILSITITEFADMNRQMLAAKPMREQIFKMNKSRRTAYFNELTILREKMIVDGLTKEAALQAVEALQEIGAKDPISRIKEAAQTRALAGAMGMDTADSERMAALTISGTRNQGEANELWKLQVQLGELVQKQLASKDIAVEMVASRVLKSTGQEQYGPGGIIAEAILAKARKVSGETDPTTGERTTPNSVKLLDAQVKLVAATEALTNAMMEGPISKLVSVLAGIGLLQGAKLLPGMGGKGVAGVAGKGVTSLAGQLTKALPGLSAMGVGGTTVGSLTTGGAMAASGAALATTGAALAAAGAVGYAVGMGIEKTLSWAFPEAMAAAGDAVFGTIGSTIDTIQNLFGIEDTAEEKAVDAGKKLLEEMTKSNEQVAAKLDEGNNIAKQGVSKAYEGSEKQSDAINNQTQAQNIQRRLNQTSRVRARAD